VKNLRMANQYLSGSEPPTLAVSDAHAYVLDTISRRVVKVRLTFAAEKRVRVEKRSGEGGYLCFSAGCKCMRKG